MTYQSTSPSSSESYRERSDMHLRDKRLLPEQGWVTLFFCKDCTRSEVGLREGLESSVTIGSKSRGRSRRLHCRYRPCWHILFVLTEIAGLGRRPQQDLAKSSGRLVLREAKAPSKHEVAVTWLDEAPSNKSGLGAGI
jgi:hypothetical protein